MGYKRWSQNVSFAEIALSKSLEKNRSLKTMEKINRVVDWSKVEGRLMDYYTVGRKEEGADAYPPLMLLKCFLLQKWFRIPSDPELENQINDRISFKKFLGLPLDHPSPDHSTFSRFRSWLSKDAMIWINNEVLQQFSQKGLSINEGIAVDARLIQSASHALGNEDLKKLKEKRQTAEGQLDKNGKPLKFARDIESDWTCPVE
jgi:IS5 family transposase